MIHRPTFDAGANPVLTLSMCAIGVLYSDYENAQAFRKSLCELLRRLLLFIVCLYDAPAPRMVPFTRVRHLVQKGPTLTTSVE
jgi:hypothetical protein